MREEDRWDEPHFVKETRKAAGYYATQSFMLVSCIILFGGMICPFFIPKMCRWIDQVAAEERLKKNPDPRLIGDTKGLKWTGAILLLIWCFISWAFFLFCMNNNGQDIFSTYNPKTYVPR